MLIALLTAYLTKSLDPPSNSNKFRYKYEKRGPNWGYGTYDSTYYLPYGIIVGVMVLQLYLSPTLLRSLIPPSSGHRYIYKNAKRDPTWGYGTYDSNYFLPTY